MHYRRKLAQVFLFCENSSEAKDIKNQILLDMRSKFTEFRKEGLTGNGANNILLERCSQLEEYYPNVRNLEWYEFTSTEPYKKILYRNYIIFLILSIPVFIFVPFFSIFLLLWIGLVSKNVIHLVDEDTHYWFKRRLLPKLYMGLFTFATLALFFRYQWTTDFGMYFIIIPYGFLGLMMGITYLLYRPGTDHIPRKHIILEIIDGPAPRTKTSMYFIMYLICTGGLWLIVMLLAGLDAIFISW